MLSVSKLVSLPRPCLLRTDVHGGVATGGRVEVVIAGGWAGFLATGWAIWSREGKRRYVESPSMARRMPDLGVHEVVVLATRNSKARPTIVRRFRKSWRAASPPPLLASNSLATTSSSLVPFLGTALSQTSSRSDRRRPISTSDSREPSAWRIEFARIVQRRCRPSRLRPRKRWRCPGRVPA